MIFSIYEEDAQIPCTWFFGQTGTSAANFAGQAYLALLVSFVGTALGLSKSGLVPFGLWASLVFTMDV